MKITRLNDFRSDPAKPPEAQLAAFLERFGFAKGQALPVVGGLVDVGRLLGALPEKLGGGAAGGAQGQDNPARDELEAFYLAVSPKRRAQGVYARAEHLLGLLLERLEFFEHLTRGLVRVCKGQECPHFEICPFKEIVRQTTQRDGELCAVEREHIRHWTEALVTPRDKGQKPRIDPRRPEAALLFKQLMHHVVRQTRYAMYLQLDDMLVEHYEALRDDVGAEHFASANKIEHPLLAGWQRETEAIQRTLQRMGLTPEFQVRTGTFFEEKERFDAEARAIEMALEMLSDTYRRELEAHQDGSAEHQMALRALEETQSALAAQREKMRDV